MFQKRRYNTTSKRTSSAEIPPPALPLEEGSDADSEEDCQQKEGKSFDRKSTTAGRKKKPHGRSRIQSLRLFLLTGRCDSHRRSSSLWKMAGFLLVFLCTASQVFHHHRHLLRPMATTMLLKDAGYSAKPTMVGCYFKDTDSKSFTGKVERIDPPRNHRAWLDLLKIPHRHHKQSVRKVEPISQYYHEQENNDDAGNNSIHDNNHLPKTSKDYALDKPKEIPDADVCQPQYDWQATSFPACNNIHEVAMMGDRMFLTPPEPNNSVRGGMHQVNDGIGSGHHQKSDSHHRRGRHHTSHTTITNDNQQQQQVRRRRRLLEKVTPQETLAQPQYKVLAHGYWRDTWMMKHSLVDHENNNNNNNNMETVAFKTMRYHHEVSEKVLDKQRRDALTSDRLTSSPQAIKMYGYCGTSALYEFAPGGDLFEFIEAYDSSKAWREAVPIEQRYQLALNVTTALADLHNTETPDARHYGGKNGDDKLRYPATAIVHADYNAHQFVAVTPKQDGTSTSGVIPHFKLGDFNLAQFVYWNTKNDHPCMVRPDGSGGEFRAPEEYAKERGRTEKLDLYRYDYCVCHFCVF